MEHRPGLARPDLQGRRALVTGGAAGIGAAIVRRLLGCGAHVIVADITGAEQMTQELGVEAWTVDLTRSDLLADQTLDVDVLVNNAGFQHVAPLEEFPPDTFEQMVRLMLTAPFLLSRASLPGMYARGWGRIINISSAHGHRASPFKAAYVAAKHGLEGLSKVIALEGAAHGVTSNCVSPGYVRTGLVEAQIADQARAHGISEDRVLSEIILSSAAVKRLVEPDEIAEAVAYLCSPAAASITGSSLALDGGWTAR